MLNSSVLTCSCQALTGQVFKLLPEADDVVRLILLLASRSHESCYSERYEMPGQETFVLNLLSRMLWPSRNGVLTYASAAFGYFSFFSDSIFL